MLPHGVLPVGGAGSPVSPWGLEETSCLDSVSCPLTFR